MRGSLGNLYPVERSTGAQEGAIWARGGTVHNKKKTDHDEGSLISRYYFLENLCFIVSVEFFIFYLQMITKAMLVYIATVNWTQNMTSKLSVFILKVYTFE